MGKVLRKSSIIFQVHSMGEIAGTQRTSRVDLFLCPNVGVHNRVLPPNTPKSITCAKSIIFKNLHLFFTKQNNLTLIRMGREFQIQNTC